MPSVENLEYVFNSILSGHLAAFNPDVLKAAPKIVKATVDLQKVRAACASMHAYVCMAVCGWALAAWSILPLDLLEIHGL